MRPRADEDALDDLGAENSDISKGFSPAKVLRDHREAHDTCIGGGVPFLPCTADRLAHEEDHGSSLFFASLVSPWFPSSAQFSVGQVLTSAFV